MLAGSVMVVMSACSMPADGEESTSPPILFGSWTPSDGTSVKTFSEGGGCRGFFYASSTGKPLDIGGPSTCQLSSQPDESGRFKLFVTQGPNEASYFVEFSGADAATVFAKNGKELYSLSRF
ncbi:hypothetical protein [Mycolicibacterium diernhoferi]|uniref:Lipocalin-like domain-containing protein n=1 Tax=Mycolicibacterium diernhoferi TaxID=1801 RepID=A0A1Q4H9G2_9MYCO|nr:hypothetical protein [Mycolicibacterium diernhoferi]OJZ64190.1 hypothetical protein BRW64_19015 [Mycolicibacterium diernhoferi]OPE49076.1 hypothetical protein BV510_22765 [Mycolicibacterium diernhoferi]PEG55204.1 hypothetical protein CRI78_06385 [Mycolicibacterium diernhoferi]QYL21775.1 hypothetical protein K0O62_22725 [Mycolicibacterium diernhoferi]